MVASLSSALLAILVRLHLIDMEYGKRIKGGQKITPKLRPTEAGRRRLEKGVKAVAKGVRKIAPVVRAVANPSRIPIQAVNRLTGPLQARVAKGIGRGIGKGINRLRGRGPNK